MQAKVSRRMAQVERKRVPRSRPLEARRDPRSRSLEVRRDPRSRPLEVRRDPRSRSLEARRAAARVLLAGFALAPLGCGGAAPREGGAPEVDVAEVAAELEAMAPGASRKPETFRGVLADTVAKDAYTCLPRPRDLFFGAPEGERLVSGAMPHYGLYFGPMQYLVRRRGGAAPRWEVLVTIAVEPPREDATLELPDCVLGRGRLEGPVVCRGAPYSAAAGTDPCPASGRFTAPATRANVSALLRRWSADAERYWNRDADAFGVPVRYDFDFVRADEAHARGQRVDLEVPLGTTCGRTPYFSAMRSGWSLPVLAHEVGHVMGLLDEYETFSGIVGVYPKTPFPGAEVSRMGLSMKESTRVLPLHHYLVLRRYACPEPSSRDPYRHAL